MISSKWLAICIVILGMLICLQEVTEGRKSGSSSGRSSSSSGRSSSSSGRSSSSSGRSSSQNSKKIQPSPTRTGYKSSSRIHKTPTTKRSSWNNGHKAVPTTRKSYGQVAQPYTPRPNSYNSKAQTTRKGQVAATPRSYGQPAQPYTPRPNSYNSKAQTTRKGQVTATPRSYGQPAQPYTPRPNSFNAGQQQGQFGQPQAPYWPANSNQPGWQTNYPPNNGLHPANQQRPPQYWSQNSYPQQQAPPWQTGNVPNNGLQQGSFNQYQQNSYWQQQSRPWQTANNYGMQQGQPQWGQSWNSQPNSMWQQPGQTVVVNQFGNPQNGGGQISSMQKTFLALNSVMTMYNMYHTYQNFKSRNQYNRPGDPNYRPGDPNYRPGDPNYRPGDPMQTPPSTERGWQWITNTNADGNTSTPQYDHHWFPDPVNAYDDYYNFSSDAVSVYDPSSEGCCHGKMFNFKQTRKRNCCGAKDYDPTFHVCCGDKTHYKRNEFTCCGNDYYNYEESLCCFKPLEGPSVVRLPFDIRMNSVRKQRTQCCGEQLFDTDTHLCCGLQTVKSYNFTLFLKIYGSDTRCCNGKIINGRTQACINQPPPRPDNSESNSGNPYPQFVGMCANELYNPREQICCTVYNYTNEVLTHTHFLSNKSSETTGCCANNTYDTKTELCCYGEVHGNATGRGCCGKSSYNLTTHWCCMGTNITTEVNITAEEDGCCGEAKLAYSSKKQMCCGNSLFHYPNMNETYRYGCCVSNDRKTAKTLDRYSEVCCDGVIHKINGTFYQECCGKELIDIATSFCCSGKVVPKTKYADCCSGKQMYNMTTHICCNAKIVEKLSTQYKACCGDLPYADQKEICCYNPVTREAVVEPRKSQWMQCCDTKPFDEATQVCCETEVIPRNGSHECCMQFDPLIPRMTHAVVKKTSPNSFCCGLKMFNPDTELCCNLTVIPTRGSKDAKCCGSALFRSERELCCNGVVQQKKFINSACCGKKAYSADFDTCCGNVIIWKVAKKDPACCYPGMEDV